MSVWLLTDDAMDAHAAPGHPEGPDRRMAAATGVRDAAGEALVEPAVQPIDDATLAAVHDQAYLDLLDSVEARGGGWLDPDTYVVPGSMLASRLAAGAALQAAIAVAGGEAEVAFAATRPPGHHASFGRGSGFCLLNNVALAAAGMRARGLARRMAIVDWDVHHGDGTQAIYEADADVCYVSTHQSPFYPGTGQRDETGVGDAAGTKHNRPLPAGAGDDAFVRAWREELLPAVEAFGPEAIVVSAGYDAHVADPLALLEVTDAGFGEVARLLGATSARLGIAGVALVLEGGYDLGALRRSTEASVCGILEGRRAATETG